MSLGVERGRDQAQTCPINKVLQGKEKEGREVLIGTSLPYLYGGDKVMRVR